MLSLLIFNLIVVALMSFNGQISLISWIIYVDRLESNINMKYNTHTHIHTHTQRVSCYSNVDIL